MKINVSYSKERLVNDLVRARDLEGGVLYYLWDSELVDNTFYIRLDQHIIIISSDGDCLYDDLESAQNKGKLYFPAPAGTKVTITLEQE